MKQATITIKWRTEREKQAILRNMAAQMGLKNGHQFHSGSSFAEVKTPYFEEPRSEIINGKKHIIIRSSI